MDENDPSRLGVLGVLPGIIGSVQANETIKIILGFDGVISNKLFLFDAQSLESTMVSF